MTSLERRREKRYQRRKARRAEKKQQRYAANDQYENIISYRSLYNANRQSMKARCALEKVCELCEQYGIVINRKKTQIVNYLKSKGLNDYGCAGLMGNLYAESGLRPNNLQNSFEKKLGYTDDEYVAAVDSGSYANFVRDSAGFGLAQWTFWSRKQELLDYANSAKKSIGDLEMQLEFLYKELTGYTSVINTLKTATSVRAASDSVLLNFERPADQSVSVQTKRAGYGQTYYDKYAKSTGNSQAGGGVKTMISDQVMGANLSGRRPGRLCR